jgi:hypothetical protein
MAYLSMNDDQVACRPTPVGASVLNLLYSLLYYKAYSVGLHLMTCIDPMTFTHSLTITHHHSLCYC